MNIRSLTRGDGVVIGAAVLLFIASFLPFYSAENCSGDGCTLNAWHTALLPILPSVHLAALVVAGLFAAARFQPERKVLGLDLRQWGLAIAVSVAWTALWSMFAATNESSTSLGFGAWLSLLLGLALPVLAVLSGTLPALKGPLLGTPSPAQPQGYAQPYGPGPGQPGGGYGYPGGGQQQPYGAQPQQPGSPRAASARRRRRAVRPGRSSPAVPAHRTSHRSGSRSPSPARCTRRTARPPRSPNWPPAPGTWPSTSAVPAWSPRRRTAAAASSRTPRASSAADPPAHFDGPPPLPGGGPLPYSPLTDRQIAGRGRHMRLGLALGYWGRGPNPGHLELARTAEEFGYDSVWTAEAWGSDAFTPLTWIAAHTSRIRLGTARRADGRAHPHRHRHARPHPGPPLGRPDDAGPRAVGAAGRRGLVRPPVPLQPAHRDPGVRRRHPPSAAPRGPGRTRRPLPRASVRRHGRYGPGQAAQGHHPSRCAPDLPVLLGAEGPKNIAQTTRIADGWLPLYWSPSRTDVYAAALDGAARRLHGRRRWSGPRSATTSPRGCCR